jgi:hypothetical protein
VSHLTKYGSVGASQTSIFGAGGTGSTLIEWT